MHMHHHLLLCFWSRWQSSCIWSSVWGTVWNGMLSHSWVRVHTDVIRAMLHIQGQVKPANSAEYLRGKVLLLQFSEQETNRCIKSCSARPLPAKPFPCHLLNTHKHTYYAYKDGISFTRGDGVILSLIEGTVYFNFFRKSAMSVFFLSSHHGIPPPQLKGGLFILVPSR